MSDFSPGVQVVDQVVTELLERAGVHPDWYLRVKGALAVEMSIDWSGELKPVYKKQCADIGVVPMIQNALQVVLSQS